MRFMAGSGVREEALHAGEEAAAATHARGLFEGEEIETTIRVGIEAAGQFRGGLDDEVEDVAFLTDELARRDLCGTETRDRGVVA